MASRSKDGETGWANYLLVFQDVEDPRRGNAKRHDLHETLVVALLAMLAGGRTCVDMEDFGSAREPWLRQFLTLENGIPSHDTFSRLFRLTLARVTVDGKSNEIPTLPELLELVDMGTHGDRGRDAHGSAARRQSWPGRRLRAA